MTDPLFQASDARQLASENKAAIEERNNQSIPSSKLNYILSMVEIYARVGQTQMDYTLLEGKMLPTLKNKLETLGFKVKENKDKLSWLSPTTATITIDWS